MGVETLGFGFTTPKRHFLARNPVVWRILRQNRCARLGCSLSQEPPPKTAESLCAQRPEITHAQNRNPWTDLDKILHGGRYHRRSYPHKFWWPSVKGFLGAGGQISRFPIDFHRRPYNTLALLCERVICKPNLKCLASSAPKTWPGTQDVEMSHVTLITLTWGIVRHHKTNTSCGQVVYEIWSL